MQCVGIPLISTLYLIFILYNDLTSIMYLLFTDHLFMPAFTDMDPLIGFVMLNYFIIFICFKYSAKL